MTYEQIWAPWRLDYVTGAAGERQSAPPRPALWLEGAQRECFLCRDVAEASGAPDAAAQAAANRANLVIGHTQRTVLVLNRFPYNNGHLLIAPRRHRAEPRDLTQDEQLALMADVTRTIDLLGRLFSPDGFNVGLNLGRVAGAGLPGHLHWHVVPRWNGDTNFMPVMAGVRVIPQSLDALWEVLAEALQQPAS